MLPRILLRMVRLRFSLASLVAAVFVIALWCAALRQSSKLWASALFTLTVGVLFIALLGAVYDRAGRRAFWLGFSLFGWGYHLFVFGPWFRSATNELLLTTRLLKYLAERLGHGSGPIGLAVQLGDHWYAHPFVVIGHLLLVVVFAIIGGTVARYFLSKARQAD